MTEKFWYRAYTKVEKTSVAFDPDGDLFILERDRWEVLVHIERFKVLKHTPKGVWLEVDYQRKFVLREAFKRFATPTPEEAIDSLRARKVRRLKFLERDLRNEKLAMEYLDENLEHGYAYLLRRTEERNFYLEGGYSPSGL